MTAIVIDTNVLLAADGKAPQMSEACEVECVTRLERVKATEQVVLDYDWLILGEYEKNLNTSGPNTPGNEFVRWLHQAHQRIAWVTVTPTDAAQTKFKEFPSDAALEAAIDPSDRKFFAASNAHPEKPPILEATDSKWLGWEDQLKAHGIKVEVLCRRELKAIRDRKTKKKR